MSAAPYWLSCLALGCAGARAALPPAPPGKSASELVAWQTPPPLAIEHPLHVEWSIERSRLDSGLGVSVVSRPDSKLTSIALWLPSAADTSLGPVATMMQGLRAGTRVSSGAVLDNPRLARQAISIETSGTGSTLTWQALPRATELALQLLADFVAHPVFGAAPTQVVLQQRLWSIQRDSGSQRHLANLARDALPGVDIETPERDARALLRLTPELLTRLHRCMLSPAGAELVVVGAASTRELSGWAASAFSRFTRAPRAAGCSAWARPATLSSTAPLERLDLQIVYGGTFDPWVVMAIPGPAPQSDEFVPFALLSRVLDSRDGRATELRHMGATYGIHARVNETFAGRSLLELEGQVAPAHAQAALRTLVEDIRALAETLKASELEEVKRRWRNGFINSLASNVAVAQQVLGYVRQGRPPETLAEWPDELGRVSLDRCREVARKWLSAAQPAIAVAGLPVRLVRGLGLGANVRELYWTDRLQEPKKAL